VGSTGDSRTEQTHWCPNCGAEYRPGITTCADCGVELVTDKPPPKPRRQTDTANHEPVGYDLADWNDDKRRAIEMMCAARRIAYLWDDGLFMVPPDHQDDVDDMVDMLDEGAIDFGDADEIVSRPGEGEPEPSRLASPGARLAGYIVDAVLVEILAFVTARIAFERHGLSITYLHTVGLIIAIEQAMYAIIAIAIWGRTIGKCVAGTKVVSYEGAIPGWRRAAIRWAVPWLPVIVLGVFTAMPPIAVFLNWIWPMIVYVGILTDKERRGLHDRAAGTWVLRAR
jgi:uncharacterized RDD family membrane protein YckC